MKDLVDLALHTVAGLVIVALCYALGMPLVAAPVPAALVLAVRELAQIQSAYRHDFLSGWHDWTWHKVGEWLWPALALLIAAALLWSTGALPMRAW